MIDFKLRSYDWSNIWLVRLNQNIDKSMQILSSIQENEKWEKVDHSLFVENTDRILDCTEAILLKASHLRARGQRQKSSVLINKVLKFYNKNNLPFCYRLAFELGIDHFINEDYTEAIENFLIAEQKVSTLAEKLFTLSNLLWCLEALDLKRDLYELKLNKALELADDKELIKFKHVVEQFNAYKKRYSFYKNNYEHEKINYNTLTQAVFFNLWVMSLPYTKNHTPIDAERILNLFGSKYLWQASYRYRTLAGFYIPSDGHKVRVPDAIDRLYLWTWCWLDKQKTISFDKVHLTLDSIIDNLEFNKLAVENKLLLRNAVKWISLFVPKLTLKYKKIFNFNIEDTSFSLLEQEYIYICSLDSEDDIYQIDEFNFKHFNTRDSLISQYIKERKNYLSDKNSATFEVNFGRDILTNLATKEKYKSESLCVFFNELKKNPTIEVKSLGKDFLNDRRKLYNFIARVKKILPKHKVEICNKQVIVHNCSEIKIKQIGLNLSFEEEDAEFSSLVNYDVHKNVKMSIEATKLVCPDGFTRIELEKNYKLSKSTVNRVIKKWTEDKVIKKLNNGKATTYVWSEL